MLEQPGHFSPDKRILDISIENLTHTENLENIFHLIKIENVSF